MNNIDLGIPSGGWEHSPLILAGMCRGKMKIGGGGLWTGSNVKMRGSGANSSVKAGVSGTEFVGHVCLALWPVANPGAQTAAAGRVR